MWMSPGTDPAPAAAPTGPGSLPAMAGGSPEADAEGWPRPDEAVAYPEVTLVAIVFGAASVLFRHHPAAAIRPDGARGAGARRAVLRRRPVLSPVLATAAMEDEPGGTAAAPPAPSDDGSRAPTDRPPPKRRRDRRRRSRWRPGNDRATVLGSRSAYSTHARADAGIRRRRCPWRTARTGYATGPSPPPRSDTARVSRRCS